MNAVLEGFNAAGFIVPEPSIMPLRSPPPYNELENEGVKIVYIQGEDEAVF